MNFSYWKHGNETFSVYRFVIYIKAGAYFENVDVEKKKKMLMFIGDGIGKTVVKANRSVVDGWTTFRSATVGEWQLLSLSLSLSFLGAILMVSRDAGQLKALSILSDFRIA